MPLYQDINAHNLVPRVRRGEERSWREDTHIKVTVMFIEFKNDPTFNF